MLESWLLGEKEMLDWTQVTRKVVGHWCSFTFKSHRYLWKFNRTLWQVTRHHVMWLKPMTHSLYCNEPEMTEKLTQWCQNVIFVIEHLKLYWVIKWVAPPERLQQHLQSNKDVPSGLLAVVSSTSREDRAFGRFLKYVSHSPFFSGSYRNTSAQSQTVAIVMFIICKLI